MPALAFDPRDAAFVVGLDLHQHIAGEELALGAALLSGAHLDHFFSGNQHIAEKVLLLLAGNTVAQRLRHGFLEARIGVNNVPTLHGFLLSGSGTTR